jgi:hypothetical protein
VECFCEGGNEVLGSIKYWEIVQELTRHTELGSKNSISLTVEFYDAFRS